MAGVRVLGTGGDLIRIVERSRKRSTSIDQIIVAMPSASGKEIAQAVLNCQQAGVLCKTIPSLGELLAGRVRVSNFREISVEDLLGRKPVHLEHQRIRESIAGRL